MAEIVNLNRARKAKARAGDKAAAAQNRVVHGRTRAQKAQSQAEQAALDRTLDGARIED